MGGLIVKEAYLLGQFDSDYKEIIKSVFSILFLSTPHRGSDMAQTLNTILTATYTNHSKQFIADLVSGSQALQSLNNRFRHVAPNLQLVSFFETRPTAIGLRKMVGNSVRSH